MDKNGLYRWTTCVCAVAILAYFAFAAHANASEQLETNLAPEDEAVIEIASICSAVNKYFDEPDAELFWFNWLTAWLNNNSDVADQLIAVYYDQFAARGDALDKEALRGVLATCILAKQELIELSED